MTSRHVATSSTGREDPPSPAHRDGDVPLAGLGAYPDRRPPRVVLSYGLGVDSTAILLRWLVDPTSRDFDLDDLVVVTAMTGDEWPQTGSDVEEHILPLLRQHGVRYVQAARSRRHVSVRGHGVIVLDDSTVPTRVHLEGSYKLSDEMREAGTVAQSSGARRCSVHAKGDVLDPVIAAITDGHPFRHVIGFEAGETRRATKDANYNTDKRTGEYPLLEWGWDRTACEDFITLHTGSTFIKSACVACCFAFGAKAGRADMVARYARQPEQAVPALAMEHTALALNPTQGLIAGKRLIDEIRAAGHAHLVDALDDHLNDQPHSLYEVRRLLRPRDDDPTKLANAARSVRTLAVGTRAEMGTRLHDDATALGSSVRVGDDAIARVYLRERGTALPAAEHFLVVAPSGVLDKQHDKFESWWQDSPATRGQQTDGARARPLMSA